MEPDTIRQHIADWVAQMGATVSQVNLAELQAMGVKISTTPAWRQRFQRAKEGVTTEADTWAEFDRRMLSSGHVDGLITLVQTPEGGAG